MQGLTDTPGSKSAEIDEHLDDSVYFDIIDFNDVRRNPGLKTAANANWYDFRPMKIFINANEDGQSATVVIRGVLLDDHMNNIQNWTLNVGVVYDLRFRRIYSAQTTGSGIKLIGA